MGYYIQAPSNHGKAQFLIEEHGASIAGYGAKPVELDWNQVPEDKALVCVIDNGIFEAVGLAFNEQEFEAFAQPDGRKKVWLLLDKIKAYELAGYKEKV